jgi:hypothetical protein
MFTNVVGDGPASPIPTAGNNRIARSRIVAASGTTTGTCVCGHQKLSFCHP